MKWKITKLFTQEEIISIASEIEIDEKWKVINPEGNWYTKIERFWNVGKVDLAWVLEKKEVRTDFESSADNLPNTAFMNHRSEWANALLRRDNGSIVEALFECIKE